jgi:hypothetical protein
VRGKDSELMARDVFAAARAGERTCERHSHDACSWRKSGHFSDAAEPPLLNPKRNWHVAEMPEYGTNFSYLNH